MVPRDAQVLLPDFATGNPQSGSTGCDLSRIHSKESAGSLSQAPKFSVWFCVLLIRECRLLDLPHACTLLQGTCDLVTLWCEAGHLSISWRTPSKAVNVFWLENAEGSGRGTCPSDYPQNELVSSGVRRAEEASSEGPAGSGDPPAACPGPVQSPAFGKPTSAVCLLPESTEGSRECFYSKKNALDLF